MSEQRDMTGKVVLVTGATNGIGEAAAREIARAGATVVIVGRNPEKTARTVENIRRETGNENVRQAIADLSVQSEVRELAAQFLEKYDRLDVLLNNAGAIFNQRYESEDGIELTFALNHLNYFLLTNLLLDRIKATAAQYGEARIINVSSGAHQIARNGMRFADLEYKEGYAGFTAYGQSKLANILFTRELAHRLADTKVTVNALHPGFVYTGFNLNNGGIITALQKLISPLVARTPEKGAETSIYLALSPAVQGVTGKYFVDKKAAAPSAAAQDDAAARRLWEISAEMTGLAVPA